MEEPEDMRSNLPLEAGIRNTMAERPGTGKPKDRE
jgi:hypothetical protein